MFAEQKLIELRDLANIPRNDGEQFIHVALDLNSYGETGFIYYGLQWKREMGEYRYISLDDAIEKVKALRKRVKF